MLRRAFVLLVASLAMAGCGDGYSGGNAGGYRPPSRIVAPEPYRPAAPSSARRGDRVAILLPLTGGYAELGQAMLRAAQLALPEGEASTLDARDTGGTPDGAANAARSAIADGAGLILGPLTSAETAAVAPVARDAGVAVLAFTNDPSQAQPGVWTLGITPGQQVRRLMVAAQAQGKGRAAALLPDTDLGRFMGDALQQSAASLGLQAPEVRLHAPGMGAINTAVRDLSGYGSRRGPIDSQIKAARALATPEGRKHAQGLAKSSIPPPPFDVLLLADTGEQLSEIAAVLPYYDIDRGAVQVLGPAQWSAGGSGSGNMPGAWYAAPDPASRAGMDQDYTAKYGTRPPAIADIAFDAMSYARTLSGQGGFSIASLTQRGGFSGVDGWFVLLPDGEVRRGLAVFRIERGGPAMVEPAPGSGSGV
jgi:branched-chain amino acid transport system substrate-binding protein